MTLRDVRGKDMRAALAGLKAEGWCISKTSGNHIRLQHPDAEKPVFCSSTPSDRRAHIYVLSNCRRALRGGEIVPEPAGGTPQPGKTEALSMPRKRKRRFTREEKRAHHERSFEGNKMKTIFDEVHSAPGKPKAPALNGSSTALSSTLATVRNDGGNGNAGTASPGAGASAPKPSLDAAPAPAPKSEAPESEPREKDIVAPAPEAHAQSPAPDGVTVLDGDILAIAMKIARGEMVSIRITRDMVGQELHIDGKAYLSGARSTPPVEDNVTTGSRNTSCDLDARIAEVLEELQPSKLTRKEIGVLLRDEFGYRSDASAVASMVRPIRRLVASGAIKQTQVGRETRYHI